MKALSCKIERNNQLNVTQTLLSVLPGRVFFSTSEEEFTFYQAGDQCTKQGSRLATTGELYLAWQDGMDVCQAGWLADQSIRYPINIATSHCGGGTTGVITMDIDPDIKSRHNAVCFQGKYFKVSD